MCCPYGVHSCSRHFRGATGVLSAPTLPFARLRAMAGNLQQQRWCRRQQFSAHYSPVICRFASDPLMTFDGSISIAVFIAENVKGGACKRKIMNPLKLLPSPELALLDESGWRKRVVIPTSSRGTLFLRCREDFDMCEDDI